MTIEKLLQILAVFALLLLVIRLFLRAQEKGIRKYKLIKKIPVNEEPAVHCLAVHAERRHLFIARSADLLVCDTVRDTPVQEMPGAGDISAVAMVNGLNRALALHYTTGAVVVFDLETFRPVRTIPAVVTEPGPVLYDLFSHRVFLFDRGANTAVVVDPEALTVIARISLPGRPMAAAGDEAGHLWVSLEGENRVVVMDTVQLMLTGEWEAGNGPCGSNLLIDRKNRLLLGVWGQRIVVADISEQQELVTLPAGKTPCCLAFDPDAQLLFVADSGGYLTVNRQIARNEYETLQQGTTQRVCRAMAMDPLTKKIYLSGDPVPGQDAPPSGLDVLVYWNQ